MPGEQSGRFRLGDWFVDPSVDEVSRDGRTVKVEPRTMHLLACLARAAPGVVSNEQLLDEVWAGVVVSPASVYQAVSQARRVLGDTDDPPKYIGTVPRKGYRLLAPVTWESAAQPAATLPAATPPAAAEAAAAEATAPAAFRRRWVFPGAVVGLAGVLALAAAWFLRPTPTAPPSIAVLPFVDLSPAAADQAFSDGVAEELSNWLSQVPNLRVVARTSSFKFRGRNEDVRAIGAALDATHVLEGSIRRTQDRVRVTAQLSDSSTGYNVWSANLDRPYTDVIAAQDEIAQAVVAALELRLSSADASEIGSRRAGNVRAYELYTRAEARRNQRTAEGNARAIELYEQALAADPRYALAHAGLAIARLNDVFISGVPLKDVEQAVEASANRALALNARLPEGFVARAFLRSEQRRYEEARNDLAQALALNPNHVAGHVVRARMRHAAAEPLSSLEDYARAATLDPLQPIRHANHCLALVDVGRFAEASTACARGRALDAGDVWANSASAWLAYSQGRLDEALPWLDRALAASPGDVFFTEMRADTLILLGLVEAARRTLQSARETGADPETLDVALGQPEFLLGGPASLRAHLAATRLADAEDAVNLLYVGRLHALAGDFEAAKRLMDRVRASEAFDRGLLTSPGSLRWGTGLATFVAAVDLRAGDRAAADALARELSAAVDRIVTNGQGTFGPALVRAELHALGGRTPQALEELSRAVDLGWRGAIWARLEPQYATLQAEPGFRDLLARVDQLNEAMRARVRSQDAPTRP
jgi:TolB-like protein/DNA-binding winged helix-turn-helix (wHTH) protein/Tfp pilus assembly protein PilF